MSSRRPPLTVYSTKRRQRSVSNPHSRPVPSSSPLKPLAHDADVTVEEMSRRMMKRSRSSLKRTQPGLDPIKSASAGATPTDRPLDELRPMKRSKTDSRSPLQTIVEPAHMSIDEDGTADMDLTDIAQLKTPVPRDEPSQKPADSTANEDSDFLSPLPTSRLSKRVLAHRISSSNLTENKVKKPTSSTNRMLLSPGPNDLASPFHSQPGSPNAVQSATKKAWNRKLNRTRSVGTDLRRRATMRSFSRAVSPASNASSPGARRHPSLPNSQGGQKENQDWLVAQKINRPMSKTISRRPSDTSIPFVRESSFFDAVPEACSTPVHSKRSSTIIPPTPGRDIDATPRMPLAARPTLGFSRNMNKSGYMLDEPTPRARVTSALHHADDSLFIDSTVGSAAPFIFPVPDNARRGMTTHMAQDSIFSSTSDFSYSVAEEQVAEDTLAISKNTKAKLNSVTMAPPSSPAARTISADSSEGDELRDMFSILGLDEDEHWLMSSMSRSGASLPGGLSVSVGGKTKKTRSSLSAGKSGSKQEVINTKTRGSRAGGQASASSVSQVRSGRKHVRITAKSPRATERGKKASTCKQRKNWPTIIQGQLLDQPIQAASDSSDELNFLSRRNVQTSGLTDS